MASLAIVPSETGLRPALVGLVDDATDTPQDGATVRAWLTRADGVAIATDVPLAAVGGGTGDYLGASVGALAPGRYELRVTAQPGTAQQRTWRARLEVRPEYLGA